MIKKGLITVSNLSDINRNKEKQENKNIRISTKQKWGEKQVAVYFKWQTNKIVHVMI